MNVPTQRSLTVILLLWIFCFSTNGFAQADDKRKKVLIDGHTPRQILVMFKFKGLVAITDGQWSSYRRVFGFLDADRDGRHSKQEYIVNGIHMNEQSRRGIFAASDSDPQVFLPVQAVDHSEQQCPLPRKHACPGRSSPPLGLHFAPVPRQRSTMAHLSP